MADAAVALSQDEIFYLTLTCYYWGSSSPLFRNVPTSEAVKALQQLYIDYPYATEDQVAAYYGWDNRTYDVMAMNFSPFNETAFFADMLPLAPHPKSNGTIVPLFIVFTVLSTIVLALRLWSRFSLLGRIQSFDWVALVSYFLIVGWGAYGVHSSIVGGQMASWCDRSYAQIKGQSIAYNVAMTIYPVIVLTIKIALLLFYYQLSTWRALRIAVWVTAFISVGAAFGGFFAFLFQCSRVDFWNAEFDLTLECKVDTLAALMGTGIVSIITDALIWIIPMPLVWKLQLYPRERIIAIFTFGLGGIACIAAGFRLKAVEDSIRFGVDGNDSINPIIAWGIIETNLALICSSAPALRALAMKHVPKILSYGSGATSDIKSIFTRKSRSATESRATHNISRPHMTGSPQSNSSMSQTYEKSNGVTVTSEIELGQSPVSPKRTVFV